jgi:hypothetical protein
MAEEVNRIEIVPYVNPANGLTVFRLTDVATGTTVMQMRRAGLRELVERAKAGEFDEWCLEPDATDRPVDLGTGGGDREAGEAPGAHAVGAANGSSTEVSHQEPSDG